MGLQRVHVSRTGSREFARVRESSREFARVRESSREFARVREGSRGFARVREGYTDGFTTDIRRIRGLTQIRERIHSGFTRDLPQGTVQIRNPNLHLAFGIFLQFPRICVTFPFWCPSDRPTALRRLRKLPMSAVRR